MLEIKDLDPLAESSKQGSQVLIAGCQRYQAFAQTDLDKSGKHKHKHNIVLEDSLMGRTSPVEAGWTLEEKKVIAAKIEQNSDLLRFCLETSQHKFGDLVESEESLCCLATTLFIQAQRSLRS